MQSLRIPSAWSLMSPADLLKIARVYDGLVFLTSLPGSPAERAGLLRGDIVICVNGEPTPDPSAFVKARELVKNGALVRFVRDGVEREVELCW